MENRDEKLWELAEARVGFKRHLSIYVVVNAFLWLLWYITGSLGSDYGTIYFPWPAWTTFGWGIGIVFHYLRVYVNNSNNAVSREYEKLKKKNK